MYIYRYWDANGEEIDMGPSQILRFGSEASTKAGWDTEEEAKIAMDEHANFGAMVSGPVEVSDDYELYTGRDD